MAGWRKTDEDGQSVLEKTVSSLELRKIKMDSESKEIQSKKTDTGLTILRTISMAHVSAA